MLSNPRGQIAVARGVLALAIILNRSSHLGRGGSSQRTPITLPAPSVEGSNCMLRNSGGYASRTESSHDVAGPTGSGMAREGGRGGEIMGVWKWRASERWPSGQAHQAGRIVAWPSVASLGQSCVVCSKARPPTGRPLVRTAIGHR
jgi:hypothetical protein